MCRTQSWWRRQRKENKERKITHFLPENAGGFFSPFLTIFLLGWWKRSTSKCWWKQNEWCYKSLFNRLSELKLCTFWWYVHSLQTHRTKYPWCLERWVNVDSLCSDMWVGFVLILLQAETHELPHTSSSHSLSLLTWILMPECVSGLVFLANRAAGLLTHCNIPARLGVGDHQKPCECVLPKQTLELKS